MLARDERVSVTEPSEGSPGSSDFTSESRSSSFTSSGQGTHQKQFSTMIQVKDEVLVNVTSSVFKVFKDLMTEEKTPSRGAPRGIVNLLGHEADIEYSEIRDGKVEKVMEDIHSDGNSSE